jgi:hypothetical protein
MNNNLGSTSLLDLRHEIALLQTWLQELMDAPVSRFDKQLQVIDRIERLVTNFQRVRLSAQALAQAENKVRLVINNLVLIIKDVVIDKEQRQEIARRLAAIGQQYETEERSAALGSALITEKPIDTEHCINTEKPINTQAPNVDVVLITAQDTSVAPCVEPRGIGDPGVGEGTEQDIPSPRAEPLPGGAS